MTTDESIERYKLKQKIEDLGCVCWTFAGIDLSTLYDFGYLECPEKELSESETQELVEHIKKHVNDVMLGEIRFCHYHIINRRKGGE